MKVDQIPNYAQRFLDIYDAAIEQGQKSITSLKSSFPDEELAEDSEWKSSVIAMTIKFVADMQKAKSEYIVKLQRSK